MNKGDKIGLMDSEGKWIKIGDIVRVKVWSYYGDRGRDEVDIDVLADVLWVKCAVCLRRLDNGEEKFMSCYYLDSSVSLTVVDSI